MKITKPDALVYSISYQGQLVSKMNPEDAYTCVINAVSKAMYTNAEEIINNRNRSGYYPFIRHAVRYWLKTLTEKMSLHKIGKKTGGVNHAMVLHSIKIYKDRVECYSKYADFDARIKRCLSAEQAKMGFEIASSNPEEVISNWDKIRERFRG